MSDAIARQSFLPPIAAQLPTVAEIDERLEHNAQERKMLRSLRRFATPNPAVPGILPAHCHVPPEPAPPPAVAVNGDHIPAEAAARKGKKDMVRQTAEQL